MIRQVLLKSFQRWERAFIGGIQQMKDLGMLRQEADTGLLATTLLAALQGGLLLCQAWKDVSPLETSLNGAVGYRERSPFGRSLVMRACPFDATRGTDRSERFPRERVRPID